MFAASALRVLCLPIIVHITHIKPGIIPEYSLIIPGIECVKRTTTMQPRSLSQPVLPNRLSVFVEQSLHGYLLKQKKGIIQSYERRWFELGHDSLFYFEVSFCILSNTAASLANQTQSQGSPKSLGSVPLDRVSKIESAERLVSGKHKESAFAIVTTTQTFVLVAEDPGCVVFLHFSVYFVNSFAERQRTSCGGSHRCSAVARACAVVRAWTCKVSCSSAARAAQRGSDASVW